MTITRRPSPFGELLSLRQAMDRLFEDSFVRPSGWGASTSDSMSLPVDVSTSTAELTVQTALPGIKPEDVEITVENGTLTIRGETRSERKSGEGDYLVQEIRRGTFARSIALPNGLEPDKATASFENGLLTLRIPRAEQVKPRQIRITPTVDGTSLQSGNENGSGSGAAAGVTTGATNGARSEQPA
jgi:HSP20 family protein